MHAIPQGAPVRPIHDAEAAETAAHQAAHQAAQQAAHPAAHPAPRLAAAPRAACAVAALATTTLGLSLLLGGWQPRTELLWLTASPLAHAEILACDQEPAHGARARCRQAIVDDRLHAAQRSLTVATVPAQAAEPR